jgi:iron complex outermembrane receptor protein
MVYASWGEGVESERVPDRPRYVNAGAALPALKSRQFELGAKSGRGDVEWSVAAFDIRRPRAADIGACDVDASCLRRIDGAARHRGLEGAIAAQRGPWSLQAGGMVLRARREGASDPALNGRAPENVPRRTLKLLVGHDPAALPDLNVSLAAVHEGPRQALPDNSERLPGWTRLDLSARWAPGTTTWRVGVDNLTDKRGWREAPYQFGHVYLFPLAPRTWRASVALGF